MTTTIKLDGRQFQEAIKKFAEFEGRNVVTVARQQFRLLNKRLMDWTPPTDGKQPGTGLADKKAGIRSIERDLAKVFYPMDARKVRRYQVEFPGARTSDGLPLFASAPTKSIHERFRNNQGRVRRNLRGRIFPSDKTGKNFYDRVHVPKPTLKTYVKLVSQHVGKAKGGWASGGRLWKHSVPPWVSQHSGQGTASDRLKQNGTGYLITSNRSAGAGNRGAAILNKAVASRIRDIEAKMKLAMKAGWKQAGGR